MANWPHREIIYSALAAPAVPGEVIVSTCLHSSVVLRLKLLTLQSFVCPFQQTTIGPWRRVISARLRIISRDSARMLCVYLTAQNHRPSLFSRLSHSGAWVSLPLVWSSRHTLLLGARLTVLPRRIPPCRLFDLITMQAWWRERRWVTLHLTTSLPASCVVCCMSASLSFIKSKSLLPSTVTPIPLSHSHRPPHSGC